MKVAVSEIGDRDLADVGQFLHENLNRRVSALAWTRAMSVPWKVDAPNHGFMLRDEGRVVGAHLAFYAERSVDGVTERFCNLGAWCVEERYRLHSLKLLKALLAQDGYTFTDMSPSGPVVPLNERLKFEHLDTSTALIPGLPWPTMPSLPSRPHTWISSDPAILERSLTGRNLKIYHDHADAEAARHVLLTRGDRSCYVVLRKDRRKNLPIFASILYVSDAELFRAMGPRLARYLLLRHGALATLAELRVVKHRPRFSLMLAKPRRKMFRSAHLTADQIDYLYSELACVAW